MVIAIERVGAVKRCEIVRPKKVEEQAFFAAWRRLLIPACYFVSVIYYEELFLKLYCFGEITLQGALFTLLFTLPWGMLAALICGGAQKGKGAKRMLFIVVLLSVMMGAQAIYYRLFKTFLTIFSITKMFMVAASFGGMALHEIWANWIPVVAMTVPVLVTWKLRNRILPVQPTPRLGRLKWGGVLLTLYLLAAGAVMLCGGGALSPRYLYMRAAAPVLEVQNFGMFTQLDLEIRRGLFGIRPDEGENLTPQDASSLRTLLTEEEEQPAKDAALAIANSWDANQYQVMEIDFETMLQKAHEEDDDALVKLHQYFATQTPTKKNEWTGMFEGKNLVWIVAEGFCSLAMDPERTPTLWQMRQEGFQFENFYTPLWGVSTSDGEYVTTTGLIPKPGIWSYSRSSENYMPFAFGRQFSEQGYTALAYHNYMYTYYDRDKSHTNMGYDYRAIGNGLELEEQWPYSDHEMMEKILPEFIGEEQFMVYCLTVSGHLNYTVEENAMSARHMDEVADLPYSERVKAYLACQIELELALEKLVDGLAAADKLDDTVIVISGDHYPYGLLDEEYSELLGHEVDPVFEIYKTDLILWSAAMERPVYVEKLCSSLDIMPTLSNLFNLEFDSRLMAGRDILSDAPGLVICSDYSFLSEEGAYRAQEDVFVATDGTMLDATEAAPYIAEVQNRVAGSAGILDYDYYRLAIQGAQKQSAQTDRKNAPSETE